jgi:hypothetical protein
MKPLSQNIIFYDTEFSSLDPYVGEILSVGLINLTGEELYLELEYSGQYSQWVKDNILSDLKAPKVSRKDATNQIKSFIGNEKPYMLAFVNNFDVVYTYKLFGIENQPFHWIPIDFASILFAYGIDPEDYNEQKISFFEKLHIDPTKYNHHNALDDAKLLKDTYLALISQ